jgi:hypothetical protein
MNAATAESVRFLLADFLLTHNQKEEREAKK